jgi:hypothetical protein
VQADGLASVTLKPRRKGDLVDGTIFVNPDDGDRASRGAAGEGAVVLTQSRDRPPLQRFAGIRMPVSLESVRTSSRAKPSGHLRLRIGQRPAFRHW